MSIPSSKFSSVYGPVPSWRFGRSLGIDPIGSVSTCSFNCVYCQLGEIQNHTAQRQVFQQVSREILTSFAQRIQDSTGILVRCVPPATELPGSN